MSKTIVALLLATMTTACTGGDGAAGSGDDVLPMRGVAAGDPTIVSARASCWGGVVLPGSPPSTQQLRVQIDGSDPMGKLGDCAVIVAAATEQDDFDDGSCVVLFPSAIPCEVGKTQVVGITVSNETGGVTTASVTLTLAD